MEIDRSDLLKVLDVLKMNEEFHRNRDKMNSAIHLAKEIRFSSITSETINARERVDNLLGDTSLKDSFIKSEKITDEEL